MGFKAIQRTYMSGTNRVILETMDQPMKNNKHHLRFIGQSRKTESQSSDELEVGIFVQAYNMNPEFFS